MLGLSALSPERALCRWRRRRRVYHCDMRVLGGLALLNGGRFIATLIVLGVIALVIGSTAGRVLGIVLLAVGVIVAVRMALSFANRNAKPS